MLNYNEFINEGIFSDNYIKGDLVKIINDVDFNIKNEKNNKKFIRNDIYVVMDVLWIKDIINCDEYLKSVARQDNISCFLDLGFRSTDENYQKKLIFDNRNKEYVFPGKGIIWIADCRIKKVDSKEKSDLEEFDKFLMGLINDKVPIAKRIGMIKEFIKENYLNKDKNL